MMRNNINYLYIKAKYEWFGKICGFPGTKLKKRENKPKSGIAKRYSMHCTGAFFHL